MVGLANFEIRPQGRVLRAYRSEIGVGTRFSGRVSHGLATGVLCTPQRPLHFLATRDSPHRRPRAWTHAPPWAEGGGVVAVGDRLAGADLKGAAAGRHGAVRGRTHGLRPSVTSREGPGRSAEAAQDAPAGGAEGGGGSSGGSGDARDAGGRAAAAGALRDAHGGACGHGSRQARRQQRAG